MLGNLYCPGDPSLLNTFDLSYAPPLIFYAYIPIIIVSLGLGILVVIKDKYSLQSKLLLLIAILFSLWSLTIILEWITVPVNLNMFFWQITMFLEIPIFLLSIYFAYSFLNKSDINLTTKLILILLGLPVIILLPTTINIILFDVENCQGEVGYLTYYVYLVEIISILWIVFFSVKKIFETKIASIRRQTIIFSISIAVFLTIFSLSNIFGEYMQLYAINLFGPIGMVIFLGLLSYLIVRYQTFNIKLIATQALVWVLVILIGSQFFFIKVPINFLLTGVTFVASIIFGYFLIQTVKREIEQRVRIEKLAGELQLANEGQANLINIINHQLKGYLSKSRNIFAELLTEPAYGACTDEARPMLDEGFKSLTEGVAFVKDFLDAANVEKGTYTYKMGPLDLKTLVLDAAEKEKGRAEEKGLSFEVNVSDGDYNMNGDKSELGQAVKNLIDNSILYTPKGGLKVSLERKNDKFLVSVKDTGVGISDELKPRLFTKGGRAKDSLRININSTGFGLAFVKGVAEAHKGRAWADSEGPDKGSTFYMELPVG